MKRKIFIYIFLVITVGGIIFTAFTAYRFSSVINLAVQHSAQTIKEMYIYSKDKQETLQTIKNMPNIQAVQIIPLPKTHKIKTHNECCVIMPISNNQALEIKFKSLAEFENERYSVILETIIINLIFIAISNLLLNWLLNPYLNIFEELRGSIEKAKQGNFSSKLHTGLKNELQQIVENYNRFLEQLNKSFSLISHNLNILIPNAPQEANKLSSVQTNMKMLADINKFKKIIEEDSDVDEIYKRIIEIFENKFALQNFVFYSVLNEKKEVKIVYKKGKQCCSISNPLSCRAYRTTKEINSFKFPHVCPEHICEDMVHICIPFSTGGTFTGIVSMNFSTQNWENQKNLIPYIESYLNESASIVEAKYTLDLMKQSSLSDQLTGLYNRRYLEEMLEKIAASTLRGKTLLGVLMIDIDYFKKVNDTYGHDAGDEVLKSLSQVLVNNIRQSDFVVRFGGEEFIIILQNLQSENSIAIIAEKIRHAFEETKIGINGKIISKTISIGTATFPTDTNKIWKAIKYADLALYEAKKTGRNKVVKFTSNLLEENSYEEECEQNK